MRHSSPDPAANTTDVYAFVSERNSQKYLAVALAVYPHEEPGIGTQANDSAKMQIAMLQSTVKKYQQGVAVVVWNSETQEGILKLEKMPPVATDKD